MDGTATPPDDPRRIGRRHRWLAEAGAAVATYTAAAVAVTWPVARDPGGTVLGVTDSDSAATLWLLDAYERHGYRIFGETPLSEVGVPLGISFPGSTNLQWLASFFPAHVLAGPLGVVTAYNVVLLAGFVLSGLAMYALARAVGISPLVAGWAGLLYVIFPWHVERAVAGHLALAHLECLPLAALALLVYHRRPSHTRLGLVALSLLLCWLSFGYFGLMAAALVPLASWSATLALRGLRGWRLPLRVTAVAGLTSVVVAVLGQLGGGTGSIGAARTEDDVERYALRALELVVPSPGSPLLERVAPAFWEPRRHGSNIQEVSNYLGLLTLLLAVAWLVWAALRWRVLDRGLRALTFCAAGAWVVAFLLALPSLPARALFAVVPEFRVPSRWTVVLMLATALLAALALERLVAGARRRGGSLARVAPVIIVAAAAAVSWVELRAVHPGVVYHPAAARAEDALIDSAPAGALAEYPLASWESSTTSAYVLAQLRHRRPLLNAIGPSSEVEAARRMLLDPAADGVAAELAARGVTTVVTRPNSVGEALDPEGQTGSPRLGEGFALLGVADGASVWRVVAEPAQMFAAVDSDSFERPVLVEGDSVAHPLAGPTGTITVEARAPGSALLRLTARTEADTAGPVTLTIESEEMTVGRTPTSISLPLEFARAGVQRLTVGLAHGDGPRVLITIALVEPT